MWSVVLKILSISGIVLLCLLGLLLLVLLLVLFMPVVYWGGGKAHGGEYEAWFGFRWLLGLVRGEFAYPRSKALRIKVLWLTVFDSGGKRKTEPGDSQEPEEETAKCPEKVIEESAEKAGETIENGAENPEIIGSAVQEQAEKSKNISPQAPAAEKKEQKLLRHFLSIVQDQENQELVKDVRIRLGKLLRSIRPRMLRAEGVVGLGEPDSTGYFYGAYWTLKPFLGKKCRVNITPDFEQRILEGEVSLRGRIVTAMLLYQVARVVLDKRLQKLLSQLRSLQSDK